MKNLYESRFLPGIDQLRRLLLTSLFGLLAIGMSFPSMASESSASLVLMLRHANAPGVGDPVNLKLGDCSTQRNLDQAGKEQSRRIGQSIRELKLIPTRIWASQWCRATQTAELTGLGEVIALPSLNSTFRNRGTATRQTAELKDFLAALDPKGGPYLMVTHQVVISDLTNRWSRSGHGVWLVLTGDPNNPWTVFEADTDALALPETSVQK